MDASSVRTRRVPVWSWPAVAVLGALVGLVGTFSHRASFPWGLVLALAAVVAVGVLARALTGWIGLLVAAGAWVLTVQVLAGVGPGGDVLIPAHGVPHVWAGLVWSYGGVVAFALAMLAPRRWFVERVDERDAERADPSDPGGVGHPS